MPYEFEVLQFRITPDLQRFYLVPPRGMLPNPATDDRSTLGAQFIVDDGLGGSLTRNNTIPAKKEDSSSPSRHSETTNRRLVICAIGGRCGRHSLAYMFSSVVRGATVARRAFAGHRGGAFDDDDLGPGNDGAMPPPDPGGAVRRKRARRPGRSRAAGGHSEQRSAPGLRFCLVVVERADRSRGPERFRRSWRRSPRSWSIPARVWCPRRRLNTVVFTGGIKVLLKGLTWPGVINSWFLGTVRASPFRLPSLPRFPLSIERAIPRGLSRRARAERDDEPGQQILPTGAATRRCCSPPGGPQME